MAARSQDLSCPRQEGSGAAGITAGPPPGPAAAARGVEAGPALGAPPAAGRGGPRVALMAPGALCQEAGGSLPC